MPFSSGPKEIPKFKVTVNSDKENLESPPCALDICLSNWCNMACRYCYVQALNKGRARFLTFEEVARGVDIYLSHASCSQIDKISISGGEPFLNYPLLIRIIEYIRRRAGEQVDLEVFTNGTLLTPEAARELVDLKVRLIVSIDGDQKVNDRNRVFRRAPRKSAFETVMANLRRVPRECVSRMHAGVTFNSRTAACLAKSARFLHGLGFAEVQLNMDLLEIWEGPALEALRAGVRELAGYFHELALREMKAFDDFKFGLDFFLLVEKTEGLDNLNTFREVSLAPDGLFYPSGLVSTCGPHRKKYHIGDLQKGLDFKKMVQLRREAVDYLKLYDARYGFTRYISNPMLLYFAARLWNLNPDKLFKGTRKAFDVIYEHIGSFLHMEDVLDTLKGDRLCGNFTHPPRWTCPKNLTGISIHLEDRTERGLVNGCRVGDGGLPPSCNKYNLHLPGLAFSRDAVDGLLYSPGARKFLLLGGEGVSSRFELVEAVVVYALLKAAHLRKKLFMLVSAPRQDWWNGRLPFLKEHGVIGGVEFHLRRQSDFTKFPRMPAASGLMGVIYLYPDTLGMGRRALEGLMESGFCRVLFRLSPYAAWNAKVPNFNRLARDIERLVLGSQDEGQKVFIENISRIWARDPSGNGLFLDLEADRHPGEVAFRETAAGLEEARSTMALEFGRVALDWLSRAHKEPALRDYIRESLLCSNAFCRLFHGRGAKAVRQEGS